MPGLDVSTLADNERPTGAWAAALLHALARDEATGRRRPRLTEPKLDTWTRFRGRLTSVDLIALLFEDAAVTHPVPFDPDVLGGSLRLDQLRQPVADGWLSSLEQLPVNMPGSDYILEQARLLGLPTKMARSELHVVKQHQKVLELPGTGGQLAHHLVSTNQGTTLQRNFVVACSSWQELSLAGVIALELASPHSDFATRVEPSDLKDAGHPLRQRAFDFVIGLHPDKGGLFRIEDQLTLWFPTAKIFLV